MAVNYTTLLQDLSRKKFHPVYLLQGEEAYYIDEVCNYFTSHVIDESLRDFNQTVLYGRDVDASDIISNARRYPVMTDYQLVMVKEAQDVNSWKKEEDYEIMINYLKNPVPSTLLVFAFKSKGLDKRTKLFKAFAHAVLFESPMLREQAIPGWITEYLRVRKMTIAPSAVQLITDSLGNDLSKLSNELDKLLINVKQGEEITLNHIERNIGISKDFNVFEFQKALATKNVLKSNQIANYFGANSKNNPIVVTLGSLYSFFSKLMIYHSMKGRSPSEISEAMGINTYFLDDYNVAAKNYPVEKLIKIAGLLRQYDLKSKGIDSTGSADDELLRELVYKILH